MNDTHNIHLCFRFDKNEFSQFFACAKTTKTTDPNRTIQAYRSEQKAQHAVPSHSETVQHL